MNHQAMFAALAVGLLSAGSSFAAEDMGEPAGIGGAEKMGCSGKKDGCSGKDGCGAKKDEKKDKK